MKFCILPNWCCAFLLCINAGCVEDKNVSSTSMVSTTDLPVAVSVHVRKLGDKKSGVRGQAAVDLAQMGRTAEPAAPWLVKLLGDTSVANWMKNSKVGEEAAYALREIGGDTAFRLIVAECTNGSATVRCNAVWAFANNKMFCLEQRAIPYVVALTQDKDSSVRKAASGRLSGISGIDYGDNPAAWMKWWMDNKSVLLSRDQDHSESADESRTPHPKPSGEKRF